MGASETTMCRNFFRLPEASRKLIQEVLEVCPLKKICRLFGDLEKEIFTIYTL
jgi:hypothetical protein